MDWADVGIGAAQSGINGIFGAFNNWISSIFGNKAREHAFGLNEQAADNADKRTRALYNDLYSVGAQLKQLREAGLSPSVFYNGGATGISGQTGAEGAGAAGGNFSAFGLSPVDISQIEVNRSIANKNNADADAMRGEGPVGQANVANTIAQTAKLLADAGLAKASTALTEANTYAQNLDNTLKTATFGSSMKLIKYQAEKMKNDSEKALYEAGKAKIDFTIADKTQLDVIEQIRQETTLRVQKIIALKAETELTEAQTKQIESAIAQRWEEIKTMQSNAFEYADYVDGQREYWSTWLDQNAESLGIKKESNRIAEEKIWVDGIFSAIAGGMDMAGSYMQMQNNSRMNQDRIAGRNKPTYTTKTNYDKKGRVTSSSVTHRK